MSTGAFQTSKYLASYSGDVHPIRIQPETLGLTIDGTANAAPAGDVANSLRAIASGGRRVGLTPRKLGVRITASGPNGYLVGSALYVPWLNEATFQSVVSTLGATGTYNGADVEVIGSSPERYRP